MTSDLINCIVSSHRHGSRKVQAAGYKTGFFTEVFELPTCQLGKAYSFTGSLAKLLTFRPLPSTLKRDENPL